MAVELQHIDGRVVCPKCGWSKPDTRNWRHVCRPKRVAVPREPGEMVRRQGGPGTELQKIITKRLGQKAIGGCGCASMINKMNKAGVKTCRVHIHHFTNRLVEVATKRNWVIEDIPEENVDPNLVGNEVPQTIRTKWARRFARITTKVPGGMSLIEWQCRRMIELAIRRAERNQQKQTPNSALEE